MNVVHLGKYYWPYHRGIETYLRLLSERLAGHVNLDVLVTHDSLRTVRDTVNGVRVTRLGRLCELSSMSVCPSLPIELRRLRPDVVHVHLPNPWAELCWYLAGKPGRLVVSFHSDIIRQRILLQLHKPLHRAFLRAASRIIVATPRHIEFSPFLAGLPPERCTVIPYGIDPARFAPTEAAIGAARGMRARFGAPLVLFAGHLVYYKGVDVLISAAARVNAQFMIVGTGPLRAKLEAFAAHTGVAGRVHFMGALDEDDLVAAYHACDVFCLPSTARSEAFGIVQLEAFAAGKPVVSTNLPSGVPWVNRDGETGLVVPPGNAGALADALNALLGDETLRARLGAQASRRVETDFTADRMADDTMRVYEEITKQ